METKQFIVEEPINEVIKNINDSNKDLIFLAGEPGSGKTTILNEYYKENKIIIDGSIKLGEYLFIYDRDIYHIYHVCLIIKKIINYIENNFGEIYIERLNYIKTYIEKMMLNLKRMIMLNDYNDKNKLLSDNILRNPKLLLDNFFKEIPFIKSQNMTIVIDNFDTVGYASINYQETIYNLLNSYFKLILTISDSEIINDNKSRRIIKEKSDLIDVDYSLNLITVKKILEKEFLKISYFNNYKVVYLINRILSEDIIDEMIIETNGNLNIMFMALRMLYRNFNYINPDFYEKFVLNYIDEELNKNSVITGYIKPIRKLHLKSLL